MQQKVGDFRKTNVDQGQKGLVWAKGVSTCGSCGKQPNHIPAWVEAGKLRGGFQWVNSRLIPIFVVLLGCMRIVVGF